MSDSRLQYRLSVERKEEKKNLIIKLAVVFGVVNFGVKCKLQGKTQ